MRPIQAISAIALALAIATPCIAQAGKAELFGSIQDPQALAVSKAKVALAEPATGAQIESLTDEHGDYHFLGLSAGQYVLSVDKPGFRPYRQEGITLRIGDQTRLDVKLEVGQATQSVEVNAQTTLLETASGSVSYHVVHPEIETLPLDGRNFIPLVALSPESRSPAAAPCCRASTAAARAPTSISTMASASCSPSRDKWPSTPSSTPSRSSV